MLSGGVPNEDDRDPRAVVGLGLCLLLEAFASVAASQRGSVACLARSRSDEEVTGPLIIPSNIFEPCCLSDSRGYTLLDSAGDLQ